MQTSSVTNEKKQRKATMLKSNFWIDKKIETALAAFIIAVTFEEDRKEGKSDSRLQYNPDANRETPKGIVSHTGQTLQIGITSAKRNHHHGFWFGILKQSQLKAKKCLTYG